MKYAKPALTFSHQADQLIERGLLADKNILIEKLKAVSYYRLSGYWYPFREKDTDTLKLKTSLDTIWERYTFDRRLRLLVMDAIERVEVSVRTSLVYHHAHTHGAFGYTNPEYLPKLNENKHRKFLEKIAHETRLSKEVFVTHFKDKYGDSHEYLPIWMNAEIMTFGVLLTMFRGIDSSIKKGIASEYGISDKVLESWLTALNGIRNICAHHGRLWNRELGYKPFIPRERKHPQWHDPVEVMNNRAFGILTILKYLMNIIAPQSKWSERFDNLLAEYPGIPLVPMSFPENWRDCPIWKV